MRKERIEQKLKLALSPSQLDVVDESGHHAGHAGARPEGQTHYRVVISSPLFTGKSRVACHRMVQDALKDEFDNGLHALAIEVSQA